MSAMLSELNLSNSDLMPAVGIICLSLNFPSMFLYKSLMSASKIFLRSLTKVSKFLGTNLSPLSFVVILSISDKTDLSIFIVASAKSWLAVE